MGSIWGLPTPSAALPRAPCARRAALEPETHAPQGLRRLLNGEPGGLAVVVPGETLTLVSLLTLALS
mgnify:CR=1 FL=1